MPIVIDRKNLAAESMGMETFGNVLTHLQKENRLVVHVLIDGEEPDLSALNALRQTKLADHTIFVETTEPAAMALDALEATDEVIDQATQLSADAAQALGAGNQNKAFQSLAGAFGKWQNAQDSVLKVSQLLRIDLDSIEADGESFRKMLDSFGGHLRDIRSAIEARDFVALADVLNYEIPTCAAQWHAAIEAMRNTLR
jgi:hypothetical protein